MNNQTKYRKSKLFLIAILIVVCSALPWFALKPSSPYQYLAATGCSVAVLLVSALTYITIISFEIAKEFEEEEKFAN